MQSEDMLLRAIEDIEPVGDLLVRSKIVKALYEDDVEEMKSVYEEHAYNPMFKDERIWALVARRSCAPCGRWMLDNLPHPETVRGMPFDAYIRMVLYTRH